MDRDGQLSEFFLDEITDANVQFSGNGSVSAFSLSFSDLFGLVYDNDGSPLGDGFLGSIGGINFSGALAGYGARPGPQFECGIGIDCAFVTDGSGFSHSQQLVVIGSVRDGTTTNPALSGPSSFTTDTILGQNAGSTGECYRPTHHWCCFW
jgi:hypothetical protein